jgi:hypothetical protein
MPPCLAGNPFAPITDMFIGLKPSSKVTNIQSDYILIELVRG